MSKHPYHCLRPTFLVMPAKCQGFVLLGVIVLLLLLATIALTWNRRSALKSRMAVNSIRSVQVTLGQLSAVEETVWRLTRVDPNWRTSQAGEAFTFAGMTYTRMVQDFVATNYTDLILVASTPTGGSAYRRDIVQVGVARNLYIADTDDHRIRKVDHATQLIETLAGTGNGSYSGDEGPATNAAVRNPCDVWVDATNNVYLADTENDRIRKVDATNGSIATVAGGMTEAYWGDGVPATSAQVNKPLAVWMHATGDLYIADTDNHRVRRVDADTGFIATVAGNGARGYNGDGIAATNAMLNTPGGIWCDAAANLYIADTGNHRIRRVEALTGIITTVAGNGSGGYVGDGMAATSTRLNAPDAVLQDASGNLYIADTGNHRIRKVAFATGTISTVAGIGAGGYNGDGIAATAAKIKAPGGVWADAAGNLYIADSGNQRIRKVDAASGTISTVAGNGAAGYAGDNGAATSAKLKSPQTVILDSGDNMVIADTGNQRVRRVAKATGIITTCAGNGSAAYAGDGGLATAAALKTPSGVSVDGAGNTFIADSDNLRIRRVDGTTGIIRSCAGIGSDAYTGEGGPALLACFKSPHSVWADVAGNMYVSDTGHHRIRYIAAGTNIIVTVAGTGVGDYDLDNVAATNARVKSPSGLWLDTSTNLYFADTGNHRIRRVDAQTRIITTVAGSGSGGYTGDGFSALWASLKNPGDVCIDASNMLYIADTGNNVIRRVDAATGIITTFAGPGVVGTLNDGKPATQGSLISPTGVGVDAARNVYIADTGNHRIRKVNAGTGKISTIVGKGFGDPALIADYPKDGKKATEAYLLKPKGVWTDPLAVSGLNVTRP